MQSNKRVLVAMKIAFLAGKSTLSSSDIRRSDAFEHDYQLSAVKSALANKGIQLDELNWRSPEQDFSDFDAALIGTTWDYQDDRDVFLKRLSWIEAQMPLFNDTATINWNINKTYLETLSRVGAATIPTIWLDVYNQSDIDAAFNDLGCEKIVVKRQVGAGAEGQYALSKGAPLPAKAEPNRAVMVQPFLTSVQNEGEYSFVFVDGDFSHALIKKAAQGDYRVQSCYGGVEKAITPSAADLKAAQSIIEALPFATPLYARIDMVRGAQGELLLMEAEMIEPYLYPLQGPKFGQLMAEALVKRLA